MKAAPDLFRSSCFRVMRGYFIMSVGLKGLKKRTAKSHETTRNKKEHEIREKKKRRTDLCGPPFYKVIFRENYL